MRHTKHLIATLCLGSAALSFTGLCALAQPLRTAAAAPAVPPAASAAFNSAPATVAAATPAPATAAPVTAPPLTAAGPQNIDGITASVGENSVSDYELDQRVALFFATAGFKPNADDLKRARKMQLEQLIDERIQLDEARRRKITVSPMEIDKRIDEFAKRQNTSVKELGELLAKAGTSIDVLRSQIQASIAWSKVVGSEFADDVVVTPAMIADALRREGEGASKTHYRVMEIFLPVDSPDKDAEVKKQIDELDAKIRAGTPFRNVAAQYSRDPSAAAGGDMGWVYDGQLDPDINAALAKMRSNEMSPPVHGKGGWYLLGLQERQEAMGTNVAPEPVAPSGPPGTLPLARLLLPLPPSAPPEVVKNFMRNAMQVRDVTPSCEGLEKLSQDPQLKGTVFMMLGDVKLSDVSEQMRSALAQTKSGEVAIPFQSEAGVEIIARCDKRALPPRAAFKLPTDDEIHDNLFQEQIASMARRFMRDLRRNANVQQRDDNVMDAALIQ
jgi:peptidyl-prolyl cis-trans isomerase SurA